MSAGNSVMDDTDSIMTDFVSNLSVLIFYNGNIYTNKN